MQGGKLLLGVLAGANDAFELFESGARLFELAVQIGHATFVPEMHRAQIAVAGLVALLASQFGDYDFEAPHIPVWVGDTLKGDGFETAVGKYFRLKYPDWPKDERYDFDWKQLENDAEPFELLQFDPAPV